MIYLDNAATTLPKPPSVANAVISAISGFGNPSRGAHAASMAALRAMFDTRAEIAALFGVKSEERVAFCINATAALNIAIAGIHGHIISSVAEHNSVLRPLYRQGRYTLVPTDALGRLRLEDIAGAIQPDTTAIVLTHGSNVTGNVFDIESVGRLCRERGLHFILDAAQTAGLFRINMQEMHISALCFSGHKSLYGPQGTGGICLAEDFGPPPLVIGGSGSLSELKTHPARMPDSLEAGTQNTHGIAGLLEGVRYARDHMGENLQKADALARLFAERVRNMRGLRLYGDLDAPERLPIVCLTSEHMDNAELAFALSEKYDIAVRAGLHCAPLMHSALGTSHTGAVRFSFSHFNTHEEVEITLNALREMIKSC